MVVNPENLAKLAEDIAKLAQGWAVQDREGKVLVNTVSDTERGAKVNWLWAYCGEIVTRQWTDELIRTVFELYAKNPVYQIKLVRVIVQEIPELT